MPAWFLRRVCTSTESSDLGTTVLVKRAALLWLLTAGVPALAAQTSDGWNGPRVTELIQRGADIRMRPVMDSLLQHYTARADGYVYFFVDRGDGSELIPLRVDQVSLDLFWQAPNQTRQIVQAQRLEKLMPIKDFNYYVDRLTVIQNGFGNEIRVGEGRDVRGVPHPVSPVGMGVYDYLLTDSLTLRLPADPDPIRVYQVEVRPKNPERPRFVGFVYLDRGTGSIVRLDFTFTPASYIDRRNERIRVTLEHSLWDRRFWLPFRQEVEVRRQIPELDLGLSTVIRGELQVSGYDFETPLPADLFRGPAVVFNPNRFSNTSRFRDDLYDGMEEQGLAIPEGGPPTIEELEEQVRDLVRDQYLSGLPPVRPYIPNVSSIFRANRAEGAFAGAGASGGLGRFTRVEGYGGYAFGAEQAEATLRFQRRLDGPGARLRVEGYLNSPQDIGGIPTVSGVVNTGAALFFGEDYQDLVFRSGASVTLSRPIGSAWRGEFGVRVEDHESPSLEWTSSPVGGADAFRPVLPISEGTFWSVSGKVERRRADVLGWTTKFTLDLEGGALSDDGFGRAILSLSGSRRSRDFRTLSRIDFQAGTSVGDPPLQRLFLIGGRHILPGHSYRRFGGKSFARMGGSVSRTVLPGWVGIRVFGAVAVVGDLPASALAVWGVQETRGPASGFGLGLDLVHGTVQLDVGHGFGRGVEMIISTNPALWGFL